MTQIHPSAIVDSQAELAEDVVVGPFCLVGPKVCIGADTVLRSHVVVEGSTTIGARNVIYAGASIDAIRRTKSTAARIRVWWWVTTT